MSKRRNGYYWVQSTVNGPWKIVEWYLGTDGPYDWGWLGKPYDWDPAKIGERVPDNVTILSLKSEREARWRCEAALRDKDKAMDVLFERLRAAGVDCSDLFK